MADRRRRSPEGSSRRRNDPARSEYDHQQRMRSSRYDTASLSSSSSSSYIDISRTFPRNRFGGALKTFFTAPSERRRARRKRSARLLALSNSSSSSVNSDLAYGTGFLRKPKHHKVRSRSGKERERERDRESARGSDRERERLGITRRVTTDAEILAVGAGLREIAKKQNQLDLRAARDGKRPEGYSVRESHQRSEYGASRGLAPSKVSYGSDTFDEDGWESASDEESDYSVDSKLAYGSVVAGSTWGAAPDRPKPQRSTSGAVDPRLFGPHNSLRGIVTEPVGYDQVEWDQHSDFGQSSTFARPQRPESVASTSLGSLQHVYPIPTSDPDRFEAARGSVVSANPVPYISSRPDPIPIQQPQPITPVSQSVYEPGYATRSDSGILKKTNSSSGRGKSLAEAALAGVAGAAIGAAFASDHKSDVSKRRDEEDTVLSRRESSKSETKEDRHREKRDSPERERREKRREKEKDRDDDSRREKKREKRREEPREETKEERRERRREERRSERGGDDRYDDRRSKSDAGTSVVSTRTVDPFQYQVADDAFPTPTFDKTAESSKHRRIESVPTVVTVEREPDFTRKRSSSIKERPSASRSESGRDYDREGRDQRYTQSDVHDGRKTFQDAEQIYKETSHSTAPIAMGVFGAAVAAVANEGFRESRSERRRGERRGDYDETKPREQEYTSEPKRDPVLEEADRTYREIVMARKIASSVIRSRSSSPERSVVHKYDRYDDHEEEPVKIVTPPEMENYKKKGPYDAPNADFKLDHILTPKDLESFSSPIRASTDPSYFDRDSRAPKERPLLNLVQPTPIPSPLPERKFEYSEKPRSSNSKQEKQVSSSEVGQSTQPKADKYVSRSEVGQSSKYEGRGRPFTSEPDVIIGPRGTIIPSPTASTVSKGVTWGENETKHYEVESPSTSPVRSRDRSDETRSATSDSKSKGWAAITAGIVGAGAGAAIASSSDTGSKSKSKENGEDLVGPYEYRGIIVEPESPPRSSERRSPPATGPKPVSPQRAHVPGSFEDDIDFTATLAAGLQDSGFDPNIVIDDPTYHRRTSPPGSNVGGVYRAPFAETVSDLTTYKTDSPGREGAPVQGFIMGEIPDTRRDEQAATTEFDEDFSKLSKKDQKKREKAAKRQSIEATPVEEVRLIEAAPEPEDFFDAPKLSKKDQKKRDKALQRQNSLPDETPPVADEEYSAAKSVVEEPESYFEAPKKSKKKSKKGSSTYDEETPLADEYSAEKSNVDDYPVTKSIVEEPESYFETPKKSKKKSKKGTSGFEEETPVEEYTASKSVVEEPDSYFETTPKKSKKKSKKGSSGYDDETPDQWQDAQTTVSVPVDAYNDIQNGDSYATPPAVDEWDTPKKSKKKSKRDSDRYDSPSQSVAASEVGSESGRSSSKKSKDKSRKGEYYDAEVDPSEVPLPMITPSEASRDDYDDSRRSRRSTRDSGIFDSADRGDSRSVVSMGASRYEDEPRKHKKKHRSGRDDDDTKSVASAPAGDDWEDSKKTKKKDKRSSGSFFGLFGSKSEPEPKEPPKEEFDEPKKKKKSKRSSTVSLDDYNGNGSSTGKSNGNGYHDDFADEIRSDDEKRKKDSFLDNAGTLGAGVGIAGVAVAMAAQHQQSKAGNTNREATEERLSRSSDLLLRQTSQDGGSYEVVDPEISERHFRPSIDPQYGDLLPLPPSGPPSPDVDPIDDLPSLPESRPATPETERRSTRDKSSTRRSMLDTPMKSPSHSAVPLKFIMGNRPPSSPVATRSNPFFSSPVAQSNETLSSPRTRPRPTSWDSTKEYKPLYLVESNRRSSFVEEPEAADLLPALPPSRTTSRSSSQIEDTEGQVDNAATNFAKMPLSIDTGIAQQPSVDFLNSEQSTPKADVFEKSIDSKPELAESKAGDKHGDILAGAIGGAALASTIGYLTSSHTSDPAESSMGEELPSHATKSLEQPSSVDPMTKDRSSYLLQSSPPSKGIEDDVFHDTQETPTSLDVRALPDIQEREGSDIFGSSKEVSADIENKDFVSDPATNLASEDADNADNFGFSKSKKDKKKDKKSRKGVSQSSTQDELTMPENTIPVSEEAPVLDEPFIPETKKSKKKKNKSSSWEPEPEPELEPVPEPTEPLQETISREPEDFVMPESKKGKKKKGKAALDWEQDPVPEISTEAVAETVEQVPIEEPVSQEPEDLFAMPASKKGKKKKGKAALDWEPEPGPDVVTEAAVETAEQVPIEESVSQEPDDLFAMPAGKKGKKKKGKASADWEPEVERDLATDLAPETLPEPATEVKEQEDSLLESVTKDIEDFTVPGSKKGKKKKGKSAHDWEPEPEPEIVPEISEQEPVAAATPLETEEFSMPSSKKGKKKKGKAALEWDDTPSSTPEVEDTTISTPTAEPEEFALPSSKKSKKKKGKSAIDWDAIPEPEPKVDLPALDDLDVHKETEPSTVPADPVIEEPQIVSEAPPASETPIPDAPISDALAADAPKDIPGPESSLQDLPEQPALESEDLFLPSSKKDKKKKKGKSAIDWDALPEPLPEAEGTEGAKDLADPTLAEPSTTTATPEEPEDFVTTSSKKDKKKKKGKGAISWDVEPEVEIGGESTSKSPDDEPIAQAVSEETDVFTVPGSKKGKKKKNKATLDWDSVPESPAEPATEPVIESVAEPATDLAIEPPIQSTTEPVADPVGEPIVELVEPISEQIPESTTKPVPEIISEPMIESNTETPMETLHEPIIDPASDSKNEIQQEAKISKPDDEIEQFALPASKKGKKKKGKAALDWDAEPEQSRELPEDSAPQTPLEEPEPETFVTSGSKKNKKKKGKSTLDWDAEPESSRELAEESTPQTPLEEKDDFAPTSSKKNKKKKGKSALDWDLEPESSSKIPESTIAPETTQEVVDEPKELTSQETMDEFETTSSKSKKKKKGTSNLDWEADSQPIEEPVSQPPPESAEEFITTGSKKGKKKSKSTIDWDAVPESSPESVQEPLNEPTEVPVEVPIDLPAQVPTEIALTPEPTQEVALELDAKLEAEEPDIFAISGSKKSKKKKGKSAINWDDVPEPVDELVVEPAAESTNQRETEESDNFAIPGSKKSKKKKGKSAIDWDAVPEVTEESIVESEPTETPVAEEPPIDDFNSPIQSGSKKGKKKKGKSATDWDVEPEPANEPVQEHVQEDTEFAMPPSKKDKKKKGKQAMSWEPESEPGPDPIAEQIEPTSTEPDEFVISGSKKGKKSKKSQSWEDDTVADTVQEAITPAQVADDASFAEPAPSSLPLDEAGPKADVSSQDPVSVSEPVERGLEDVQESSPVYEGDDFAPPSSKKNKKKGKKAQDWTVEEDVNVSSDAGQSFEPQEVEEFAMSGSKKNKKKSKNSGSWTPDNEVTPETNTDFEDPTPDKQDELSTSLQQSEAPENFTVPGSKKNKKKSKKQQSWSLEDDATEDSTKRNVDLQDSPQLEQADEFSIPGSKKSKKKGKKSSSWAPEEDESSTFSHDTTPLPDDIIPADESMPIQEDVEELQSADKTLVLDAPDAKGIDEAQPGEEASVPVVSESTGLSEQSERQPPADDYEQSKDFASPKSKKGKKKSKNSAASWEDDVAQEAPAETEIQTQDTTETPTEFETPSKSKKNKKKSKSSQDWEEEIPSSEQSSTDSALDESGSSEPSSDAVADDFGLPKNKKSKRKSKLSQVWVADDTPAEEVPVEEPSDAVVTSKEPEIEPETFSAKGSKKSKKKSKAAFAWDDEPLSEEPSTEAIDSESATAQQTDNFEPDEFAMSGSKKNKKKSKKLQTPDPEPEPSWDDIEAMTSASNPLGKANLDPSPQTEYPDDSFTSKPKKSKKSKKSQALEIEEDPVESPAEQIQEKAVEPVEILPEAMSLSSRPTPMGGPGAWPATPITPMASTIEIQETPKTDYFPAAGTAETTTPNADTVTAESQNLESELQKRNIDGLDVGYNEEQLRLAKQMQEEFSSGSKKSKKDKKKRQSSIPPTADFDDSRSRQPDVIPDTLSRSRSLSTGPEPSTTGPASMTGSEVRQNQYSEEQLELARQLKAEQESGGKKSKKDKKKRQGVSRSSTYDDDIPGFSVEDPIIERSTSTKNDSPGPADESSKADGFAAGYQEDQLSLARQLQAEFGSGSSKKSKKDKKRRSTSQTPAEERELSGDYFSESQQPSSDVALHEDTKDLPNSDVPEKEAPDGLTAGYRAEQLELARQLKEEFSSGSKKSKKDKKRQSLLRSTTEDDFSDNHAREIDMTESTEPELGDPVPVADPEDEFGFSSKKSKKGKKRQSLLRTGTEDDLSSDNPAKDTDEMVTSQASINPEPVLPEEEFSLPTKKPKKDKKRQGLSRSATEDDFTSDNIVQGTEDVLSREEPMSTPADDEFAMPIKKSKKDKKRQSLLRNTTDDDFSSENQGKEPEINDAIDTPAASIPPPQDDEFAFSAKKSKKDKKKQSKLSTPTEEVSTYPALTTDPALSQENESSQVAAQEAIEPTLVNAEDEFAVPSKKSKKDKKRQNLLLDEPPIDMSTTPAETEAEKEKSIIEPEIPSTTTEALPVEAEDEFAFSTKKSKKDKKKKQSAVQEETPSTDASPASFPATEEQLVLEGNSQDTTDTPDDGFGFTGKKSKKDKKKRQSLIQSSALDDSVVDSVPDPVEKGLAQQNISDDKQEPILEVVDTALPDITKDEDSNFEAPTKKSKKDKKKRQNLQSPAWDDGAEQPFGDELQLAKAPEDADRGLENVSVAVPVEENQEPEFEFTSKKSKKDKKKRKSLPGTPANEEVPEIVSEPIYTEPESFNAESSITTAPQIQDNDKQAIVTEPNPPIVEADTGNLEAPFDEFSTKLSKKDKKKRKESLKTDAYDASSSSVTPSIVPELSEEIDPFATSLSRKSSKKDKRKRQATTDVNLSEANAISEPAYSSWADEVEEATGNESLKSINVPEETRSISDSKAEPAADEDFFRPTKKGKKGKKKNDSNTFSEPTAGVMAPPTETESTKGVETALDIARESAGTGADKISRRSTEPEEEHTKRTALAAAGAALTATALLNAESGEDKGTTPEPSKATKTVEAIPAKKSSKKDKRKKYVDRRPPQEDDMFDDPMLWEGFEPKAHEEVNASGDDDGFWSAPKVEESTEEPVLPIEDPVMVQEPASQDTVLESIEKQPPIQLETDTTLPKETSRKDKQIDNLPEEFAVPSSKKDKKKKKKGRLAEWDAPTEEHQTEHVEPAKEEVLSISTNSVSTPIINRELSIEDTPIERTRSPALSPNPFRRSGSFALPVLREDAEWDKSDSDPTHPSMETPDANRDSAFVTDSPIPMQRGFTDDHERVRDSGVHLRDWSPAEKARTQITADEAIARLSWPAVDEETETVDLNRSQRLKLDKEAKTKLEAGDASHRLKEVRRSLSRTGDISTADDQEPVKKSERYGDLKSGRPLAEKIKLFNTAAGAGAVAAAGVAAASRSQSNREPPRPSSVQSQRSSSNINRLRTPDPKIVRPDSVGSNRSTASATPPLRRSDRKSGDLRSLSQRSTLDLAKEAELAAIATTSISPSNVIPSTANPTANEGRVRAKDMADVYDGFGEGRIGSPRSPTRPHSMRRRQSMQVLDLESRVEQLAAENRMLAEAKAQAEQSLQTTQRAASTLADRDAEIDSLKQSLDWLHREVNRLTEVNEGLTSAHVTLDNQHSSRYGQLEAQHARTTRELEEARTAHESLSAGMGGIVENEVRNSMAEKDKEIAQLRSELEAAKDRIRNMQREILLSKSADSEFLVVRDEDYFDTACQQLCQHVQQWVLRFSKFSDMRACRLTSEINNDKIIDRLDNAILDGSDVDNYLADRVKRRDVFMSMTMTMVWEFVFTRYLFGMDREQRQKLKSLEKLLMEVGPPAAVHQWRATTLTLLAKRKAFLDQRKQDTEAVVHEILNTLFEILPPPTQLEDQIGDQLRRVMKAAVDLSIEMRTQRAEYMMLPPLQPEYDANGDLASKVSFNSALMNERSGDTVSNEELEAQKAVVRVVLFPLVVKKGDDRGEGDEEIVVCPAQVLVAKPKKTVRVFSPGSIDNRSRASMQSTMPAAEYGDGMEGSI